MKKVETAFQMKTPLIYLWIDSTIVLAWIQKNPNLLKTSVANRVATIKNLTNTEQWHHAPSEEKPADLVSIGLNPSILHKNSLWRNEPTFLATKDFPERSILSSVTDSDEFNWEFKSNTNQCVNLNVHRKLQRRKKEKTYRCPADQPSGDHLNQDSATTGVQRGYKKFERK
ncbi:integrase catalytic domain-containing protein [Trichonephila clavipes]|nr:integrase catalytic domain-containing protein [Trichonephila clavipes]